MAEEFEWDDAKNAANTRKHGISFERITDMDWTTAQAALDERQDYGEARVRVRGLIGARLHIAVFVWRNDRKRIISLRKANRREQRAYANETGKPFRQT